MNTISILMVRRNFENK